MKRRSLLIGIGSVAGAAGAVGSGAFTSVSANRDLEVQVADDDEALLAMEPSPGPNGEFASLGGSGNTLAIDVSDSSGGGTGVGSDSVYDFDDVFRVTNQGTQTVYVWVTVDFSGSDFGPGDVWFYPDGDSTIRLNDGPNSVVGLPVGQEVRMGLHVETEGLSTSDQSLPVTVYADATEPQGSNSVDSVGDQFVVVDQDGGGDFTTINGALSSVSGTTILVRGGTYDENLAIGSPDAGTDPASAPLDGLRVVGRGNPTVDGFVQILDPNVTFEGFEVTGEYQGFGVAAFEPGVTIRNNVVRDVANGIYAVDKDILVADNEVVDYTRSGLFVSNQAESGPGTPQVLGNTFEGTFGGTGIPPVGQFLVVDSPVQITGNTFRDNTDGGETETDGTGLAFYGGGTDEGVSVTENYFLDNETGLFFAGPGVETATVSSNDIVGNTVYGIENVAEATLTAEGNWWGTEAGPFPGEFVVTEEEEEGGEEPPSVIQQVFGPVDFIPWSTEAGPDWNADGTPEGEFPGGSEPASTSDAGSTGEKPGTPPSPPSEPEPTSD